MTSTTWISSAHNDPVWHLGREKESRGVKSGEVLGRYVVAACNGRQIGGAWGHRTWRHEHNPPRDAMCQRCAKIAERESAIERDANAAVERDAEARRQRLALSLASYVTLEDEERERPEFLRIVAERILQDLESEAAR